MKRKLLATLLSVAMATTLLAGCGSGSTEAPAAADSSSETTDTASTEAPAADGEVQEITWMFWDDLNATEDLISKGYADVIDRFNTEYAGQYHVTPITCSAGTARCLSMVAGYLCESKGVDLAAIADGSDTWENGKLEAAATDLVELSKYFQKTAAGDTNDVATANFYNEEAAILIQGSWAIGQINGENPDFESKCGVFQFPGVERVIAKSDSLAMSSTSKCPEACVALMKMFTDDTAQKYTAEVGGKIPVTNVEYDANVAPAQLAYVMDVFSNAKGTFGFYNESMPSTEAGAHFDDDMVAVFLGDMTPAEAATDMEEFYAANCR